MPRVTAIVSRVTNAPTLVQGHDYEVIGIEDDYFRIIDESGEPDLLPKSFFSDEEVTPPDDWEFQDFGDGQYSYYPREFATRGFFEHHADGQAAAVQTYKAYLEKLGRSQA